MKIVSLAKNIMKTRYFIFISFKGTVYHGWQLQPGKPTVQGVLDNALSVVLQEDIKTTGAGRTDSGVHARFFAAHFDSGSSDLSLSDKRIFRLTHFLNQDVGILDIRKVRPDAHARFDAISRTYEYHITTVKDPFLTDYALYRHGKLDIEAMNSACTYLPEYTDFTSFSKLHSDTKTNDCNIFSAAWEKKGDLIIFSIRANRFLRNMVRAIVGTMLEIGTGRLQPVDIRSVIEAKDRQKAGKSVRPHGLYLTDIDYPDDIFI